MNIAKSSALIVVGILFFGVAVFFGGLVFADHTEPIVESGEVNVSAMVEGCGDGIIQIDEECDGLNLDGQTCSSLGFFGGNLSCNADCTFNIYQCELEPPISPPSSGGAFGGGVFNPFFDPHDPFIRKKILSLADFNEDGRVNIIDLSILLHYMALPYQERYDLSGDGIIDFTDISILMYYWTG